MLQIYIDDSGPRLPDKQPHKEVGDALDVFALGGVIIESEFRTAVVEEADALCEKFSIDYPLHSSSIRCRKGPWSWLNRDPERANSFYVALSSFLMESPIVVLACVVSRPGYNARYERLYGRDRWKLCRSAYAILLERAVKYASEKGDKLDVYVEETGKKEDRLIRSYHHELRASGAFFDESASALYAPATSVDFKNHTFKNPRFIKKANRMAQLADLVLYPMIRGFVDSTYLPYTVLRDSGKLIDSFYDEERRAERGIKYYCFDLEKGEEEKKKGP